jgi:thiol:disulfide interchange protein DsbC
MPYRYRPREYKPDCVASAIDRRTFIPFGRAVCAGFVLGLFGAVTGAAEGPPPVGAPQGQPPALTQKLAPSIAPQYADLAKKLSKGLPEYTILRISPSAVDGILEVVLEGDRIVYTDAAGKHLFNGHLFELDTHEDLTEGRLEAITRVDTRQLPLADAFDVVRGNGKREVFLFEDPDCPYCRKFEEELPKVDNVTLHVFLFPLTGIHPHAYEHALGIWCAKDRQKAWADKMLKGIDPPAAKCPSPIDRNLALGDKLRVDGTPTMIFADGRMHGGSVSAQEFEHLLAEPHRD